MKVKVSKQELYECVENAVIRALKESKAKKLNEWYDDDDDEVSDIVANWERQQKKAGKPVSHKRLPGVTKKQADNARKAAMDDMKAAGELDDDN